MSGFRSVLFLLICLTSVARAEQAFPAGAPMQGLLAALEAATNEVFDYIRYDGQGNTDGDESGKLIARQREGK
jgi:hypothetical protein